jgi:arsenate reductase-like glutaredoxin family protein
VEAEEINLSRGLSAAQIDNLIGSRDYKDFLNTRNEVYKARKMKENPPTRAEAIKLMVEHPNLIRRPILVSGGKMAVGFDEKKFSEIARG